MAEQDDIRTDLDVDVFAVLGKTVTLKNYSSPSYNTRGELESVVPTESTITIVPYSILNNDRTQEVYGDLNEGRMEAVLRYDQSISLGDELVIESESWIVDSIEKNYLPDNVATIVSLVRDNTIVSEVSSSTSNMLLENGDIILLENGDTLLLEA